MGLTYILSPNWLDKRATTGGTLLSVVSKTRMISCLFEESPLSGVLGLSKLRILATLPLL